MILFFLYATINISTAAWVKDRPSQRFK